MQNTLTTREEEILTLISQDLDCKEIAAQLNISVHTVQAHRRNLFKKIKAKTVIGLVNYAHKHNLVSF